MGGTAREWRLQLEQDLVLKGTIKIELVLSSIGAAPVKLGWTLGQAKAKAK